MCERRLRGVVLFWSLLATLQGVACSDEPVEPEPPVPGAVLTLVSVEDQTLPARIQVSEEEVVTIRADLIRTFDDDTWERTRSFLLEGPVGPIDRTETESGFLTPVERGFVLDFECEDTLGAGACLPPDTVRTGEDGPRIRSSAIWFFLEDLEFVEDLP